LSEPLVSVLIPAFNAGPYLLASVSSILEQTHSNLEVWVVDDGSTDGSFDTLVGLQDERLRVVRQANMGKPATLNALLDRIHGDYYALHDADDISHPERLSRQVHLMERSPSLGGCFTGYDLIMADRRVAPRFRAKDPEECADDIEHLRMPGHDPTVMFRTSMAGGFRYEPKLTYNEGHDLILRVGEKFPLQVLGRCLYSYRVHPESITRKDPSFRLECVREVARRACARRGIDPAPILASLPKAGEPVRARDRDNNLAAHFIESAIDQRAIGDVSGAIHTGLACIPLHPFDFHYYKALAYAAAPPKLTSWFRSKAQSKA
jgi:glycosyltransferase involved in cell wall biosynthesis